MGKWWRDETGLPLPLGGNAIRRATWAGRLMRIPAAPPCVTAFSTRLTIARRHSQYAMQFARDLEPQMADKFVGMYVNERTLDYGKDGREAIARLLEMGYEKGIIPHKPNVEFVGDSAVASAP